MGQFASKGKICRVGMGRLERVVGSPQVGLRVERDYLRKARRKRRLQERIAIDVICRNRVDAGDSRQVFGARDTIRAASVLERDGVAGGADLIEAVDERESRAVVHAAEAGANDRLVAVSKELPKESGIGSGRV